MAPHDVYIGARKSNVLAAAVLVGLAALLWPGLLLLGLLSVIPFIPDGMEHIVPPVFYWLFLLTPAAIAVFGSALVLDDLLAERWPDRRRWMKRFEWLFDQAIIWFVDEDWLADKEGAKRTANRGMRRMTTSQARDPFLVAFLVLTLAASAVLYRIFFILHARVDDGFVGFLLSLAGLPFATALGTTALFSLILLIDLISPGVLLGSAEQEAELRDSDRAPRERPPGSSRSPSAPVSTRGMGPPSSGR
jgi:hypothetical protein